MRALRAALLASWPFLVSLALVSIVVMSTVSVATTVSQRNEMTRQSRDLHALVEGDRRSLAVRQKQLDVAIDRAAEVLHQILAEHDKRVGESHELLFNRIAELLGRPVSRVVPPTTTTTTCPQAGQSGRCR